MTDPLRVGDDTGPERHFSTDAVHAGEQRQKPCDSVAEPIFCTTTYAFSDTQSLVDFIVQKQSRPEYARYRTPNETTVEQKLAALEGAEAAVLYATGMTAIAGLILALLGSGDELVLFAECYQRTRDFCTAELSRFGIRTRFVRINDFEQLAAAITPATKLLLSESPTNPHLSVVDVARFAEVGRQYGVATAIDSTLATPCNIGPWSSASTTCCTRVRSTWPGTTTCWPGRWPGRGRRSSACGPSAAWPGWSIRRTTNTFAPRHENPGTADAASQRKRPGRRAVPQRHPRIEKVFYPGLPSHPTHAIASRTMRGFGGLVTFLVKNADWRQTADVVDAVRIPRIAASLGGVESLIEQPLVLSYYENTPEERRELGIPDNMIRLSCGIEDSADLIADLDQVLEKGGR